MLTTLLVVLLPMKNDANMKQKDLNAGNELSHRINAMHTGNVKE